MKSNTGLSKYYSLDECTNQEEVFGILNDLLADAKISYEEVDSGIIKIIDRGLTTTEVKSILTKFNKYDVLEYTDRIDDEDDEDDEEYDEDENYIWED